MFRRTGKARKVVGVATIAAYSAVCVEGVVMNLIDVVRSFSL